MVRVTEGGPKLLEQSCRSAVGVGLEHGPDSPSRVPGPCSRQRRPDLGWVVGIIVHHRHPAGLPFQLKAARRAPKLGQRPRRRLERDPNLVRDGQRCQRIQHVVSPRQPQHTPSQPPVGVPYLKAGSSPQLNLLCPPVPARAQANRRRLAAYPAPRFPQPPRLPVLTAHDQQPIGPDPCRKPGESVAHIRKGRITVRVIVLNRRDTATSGHRPRKA